MKSSFLWSISALTAPYRPRLPSASQLRFLSTRSAINRGLNRSTRDRGSRNTEVHRNDNRAALKPWERASSDHSPFIRNKSPSRSRSGDHRSDFRRQSQSSSQTYYEPDARDDIKPRRAFGSRGTAINGNARSQIEFKPSKSRDVAPWKTSRRPTNQDAPMRRHMEGRYESPPNDMMRREPSTRRTHDHGVSEYEGLSRNREGIDHDQPRRLERGPRSPPRTVVPMNVTYTTPASEFLYGTSSVKAALASRRRQFYKLYICGGEDRVNPQQDDALERFAERYGVPTLRVTQEWSPLMDKMSSGRPHNVRHVSFALDMLLTRSQGYVLEASPLPKMPITCLESVSRPGEPFSVAASHQSREEVLVNGMDNRVKYDAPYSRYPFILMLDGIVSKWFSRIYNGAKELYSCANCMTSLTQATLVAL